MCADMPLAIHNGAGACDMDDVDGLQLNGEKTTPMPEVSSEAKCYSYQRGNDGYEDLQAISLDSPLANKSQIDRTKSCQKPQKDNSSLNHLHDPEKTEHNARACSVDPVTNSPSSQTRHLPQMGGLRTSSLAKRAEQQLQIYAELKESVILRHRTPRVNEESVDNMTIGANQHTVGGIYEEGEAYCNSWFAVRRMSHSGGVLQVTGDSEDGDVVLRVPEGALSEPRDIYMAVDWYGSGFSPTVRCGPPGTRFNKRVYIFLPIYGNPEELILRKREDEGADTIGSNNQAHATGWVENPASCSYLLTKDICAIETDSFSDHEMTPKDARYKDVNLQVYVQQPGIGERVCIRYYLTENHGHLYESVADGEKGLGGFCVEDSTLRVKNGREEIKSILEPHGLLPLEQNLTRTITEEWISNTGEMASCFILRKTEDADGAGACLKFELPSVPRVKNVKIKLQKRKALTDEQEAVLLQDDVKRRDSPTSILSDEMVETLAIEMDVTEDRVLALAKVINMPIIKLYPDKIKMHGGSGARYVLRFYEYLCMRKRIDSAVALEELHTYLLKIKDEVGADIVKRYFPSTSTAKTSQQEYAEYYEGHAPSYRAQRDPVSGEVNEKHEHILAVRDKTTGDSKKIESSSLRRRAVYGDTIQVDDSEQQQQCELKGHIRREPPHTEVDEQGSDLPITDEEGINNSASAKSSARERRQDDSGFYSNPHASALVDDATEDKKKGSLEEN